ncbi:linker for activation of T-cells family member 2 isoform X1 [Pezoporus occidentalis]|uniref:linker for activation of T-cells family member 2 isoform X1 n=1 Tax=Pezoporus occidentalis TaxID=407982 RepID=UPI002F911290
MVQMELLWAAAALMLLGAAISLCAKCQRSATKREKQLNDRRSQLRSRQSFEVIRSHSTMTRRLEQVKEPENLSIVRKTTKELGATHHAGYGSRAESRYRDFWTEDCLQGDDAYVSGCGQEELTLTALPAGSPYLWITTTVPRSSHHPMKKRRIPIPTKTSSLDRLRARMWMMLQTTRTARRYTHGNSIKQKLCRQKAWMMSQTMSTQLLHQALPRWQSKVLCVKPEEVLS